MLLLVRLLLLLRLAGRFLAHTFEVPRPATVVACFVLMVALRLGMSFLAAYSAFAAFEIARLDVPSSPGSSPLLRLRSLLLSLAFPLALPLPFPLAEEEFFEDSTLNSLIPWHPRRCTDQMLAPAVLGATLKLTTAVHKRGS